MNRIAVFCGSSLGADTDFALAAHTLGQVLARERIGLVYGGGNIGLMGKLATACLEAGGHVIGVIPRFMMTKEIGRIDLPDLRIVESMHERKALMAELANGFMALPGGFGTLEELCEILTWSQLGLHAKPLAILNVDKFYDHFLAFLDEAVARGLIRAKHRELVISGDQAEELLQRMREWRTPITQKWITPEKT